MTENFNHHAQRRAALAEKMRALGSGIAVIPTAPECRRNQDNEYPYRFDSYFHYLTGFTEPESTLVLIAGDTTRAILFCREKNEEREIWDGFRHGPDAAREMLGMDEAYVSDEFDTRLPELLGNQPALWYAMGQSSNWDTRIMAALQTVKGQVRSGIHPPADIRDVHRLLDEMRLIKDKHEIATMRRAAAISAGAHRRAMRSVRPGMFEYEIEAELLHEFRRFGSQAPAYNSIVASGPNACVLHYQANNRQMDANDLLMIDAGCELDGYASDISRTFPVGGKFQGAQRDVYALVLSSQKAALSECRVGKDFNAPHNTVVNILSQGLLDLGLLQGSLDEVISTSAYRKFYMHRTSHWLGMDVHDVGQYKQDGIWRDLQAGMVLTIEPGLYIRPADDVPEAFWNIGIRIEDDVLITDGAPDVLTHGVPKCIQDIEDWMSEKSH